MNEDASGAPLDSGGTPSVPNQNDTLDHLKREIDLINGKNRALESTNTLGAESVKQALTYAEAMARVQASYESVRHDLIGLTGERHKEGIALARVADHNIKLMASAEKFLGITDKTNKLIQERKDVMLGLLQIGKQMNILGTEEYTDAVKRADLDFKKQLYDRAKGDWTSAINTAGEIINYQFQSQMLGAMGRGRTLMQGAGMGPSTPGGALGGADRMFGATGSAMNPLERMSAFNKILEEAPRAANQSTASMKNMIGTMAYFGASTDKMVASLIKGSREAGMTANDIAKVYSFSSISAKELGLSTMETGDNLLELTHIFRQVGGGVNQAAAVLSMFSHNIHALGINLQGVEKLELASKFVQGISSLPFDKMAGLTMYNTGKPLQAITEQDMSSPLKTAMATFQRISSQIGPGFVNQGAAVEKTAELLGMHLNALQTVSLQKILREGGTANEKAFEKLADPTKYMAEGIDNLKESMEPLKSIDNNIKNIQGMMSSMLSWGSAITGVIPALTGLRILGGAAGISGGLGTVAAGASSLVLGEEAAAAIGTGVAGAFSAPALVGVGALGALAYGGYKAGQMAKKSFGTGRQ